MAKDGNETKMADKAGKAGKDAKADRTGREGKTSKTDKADPEIDDDGEQPDAEQPDADADADAEDDDIDPTVETDDTIDEVDDDIDDLERRVAPGITPQARRQRQMRIAALSTLLALGVVILAVVLLKPGGSGSSKPKTSAVVTFTDNADHFKLSYPSNWGTQRPTGAGVKLLTTFGANGLDLLQVRVVPLSTSVDSSNVNDIKSVTDGIVSGANVTVLSQRSVQVGNVQGYDYFYEFSSSGTTLVHTHFFVFPPKEMIEIVFQTREDQFAAAANDINYVLSSFRTT